MRAVTDNIRLSIALMGMPTVAPYRKYPAAVTGSTNHLISPKFSPNSNSVTVNAQIRENRISTVADAAISPLFGVGDNAFTTDFTVAVFCNGCGALSSDRGCSVSALLPDVTLSLRLWERERINLGAEVSDDIMRCFSTFITS